MRRFIQAKKRVPCADCGVSFPYYVMDFDHVRGLKAFDIGASLRNKNFAQLKEEVEKCEVVCANCHRVREHKRRTKRITHTSAGSSAG